MNNYPEISSAPETNPDSAALPQEIILERLGWAVSRYHEVPEQRLLGKRDPTNPSLALAQDIMLTLVTEHLLSIDEVAESTLHSPEDIDRARMRVQDRERREMKFQAHLTDLAQTAAGLSSGKTPTDWANLVAIDSGLFDAAEIADCRSPETQEAGRRLAAVLMKNTVLPPEAIAQRAGLDSEDDVIQAAQSVARQRWIDEPFNRKMEQLEAGKLSPLTHETNVIGNVEHEFPIELFSQQVCDFYGVTMEQIRAGGQSYLHRRVRGVIAYSVRKKFGLPLRMAGAQLHRRSRDTREAYNNIEEELPQNALLSAQIDCLEYPQVITASVDDRILMSTAEATDREIDEVKSGKDAKDLEARQMAMAVILESAHRSDSGTANLFNLKGRDSVVEAHKLLLDPPPPGSLAGRQLNYIRMGIVSENLPFFDHRDHDADEPLKTSKPSLHDVLAQISDRLVSPKVKACVEDVVERTVEFYKRKADGTEIDGTEIVGRVDDFVVNRARQAAVLLCSRRRIHRRELAICFDERTPLTIRRMLKNSELNEAIHPVFAKELEDIENGREREDITGNTQAAVVDLYGADLKGDSYWSKRGRLIFLRIMIIHDYASLEQLGGAIGRPNRDAVESILRKNKERFESDPSMQREVDYLTNPKANQAKRPLTARDIIKNVCKGLGIAEQSLYQPSELPGKELAKQVIAYMVNKELLVPEKEIARMLGESEAIVKDYIQQLKDALAEHPWRILEIDRLRPPNSTSFSMTWKIFNVIEKGTGIDLGNINLIHPESEEERARLLKARAIAVPPLVKRAELTTAQVAQLLMLPEKQVKNILAAHNAKQPG